MDVRELFDVIDSFIAGFGEKDKSDTSNAIFIANKLFKIGLPLKWRGAGRLGIECLDLYNILDDVIPCRYKLTQITTRRGSAGTPYIINSMDFTSFVLVADPLHSYRDDYHVGNYVSR
jgi:hypothetical protein